MYAGMTIMHYPPNNTEAVHKHINEVLVPFHTELQSQGLKDALFLVNPESCQGIGIAIWDSPDKLKEVEKGNTREMARAMRDASEAPTEYTKLRAEWVSDLAGGIVSTDWYEVVGRVSPPASTLFPSVKSAFGRGKYAGMTIMNYPPNNTDAVYKHIKEVLVPFHTELIAEGLKDAIFLVNPESCQGIGIAIWDSPDKLKEVEVGTSREMARAMRDPSEAPTEYTKLRAEWVADLAGGIVSTDWYEVVGQISPKTSKTGKADKGKAAPKTTWP